MVAITQSSSFSYLPPLAKMTIMVTFAVTSECGLHHLSRQVARTASRDAQVTMNPAVRVKVRPHDIVRGIHAGGESGNSAGKVDCRVCASTQKKAVGARRRIPTRLGAAIDARNIPAHIDPTNKRVPAWGSFSRPRVING